MSLLKALNLPEPSPRPATSGASSASRRASGSARAPGKGRRPPVTEVVFEEDEPIVVPVARGGTPGASGEEQIAELIGLMHIHVGDYWDNYGTGLTSFQTRMEFASADEAEPQYLQVALKTVAKQALDLALDAAGTKLGGPWGTVISGVKGVAEAWAGEAERAATAAGQVKIVEYIESIRNGVSAQRNRMRTALESGKQTMFAEFRRLAAGDAGGGTPSPTGVLVGDAAGLVNSLRASIEAFQASIPSEGQFQQLFTRNFADTPGRSVPGAARGVPTGKVYFGLSVYVDPTQDEAHPKWELRGSDERWMLVTKAPNPDRVAGSLHASLGGQKPWQVDLEKMVKIRIELEEPFTNTYMTGWILFRGSPDSYEVRSNYGKTWFDRAWQNPELRRVALDNAALGGAADY